MTVRRNYRCLMMKRIRSSKGFLSVLMALSVVGGLIVTNMLYRSINAPSQYSSRTDAGLSFPPASQLPDYVPAKAGAQGSQKLTPLERRLNTTIAKPGDVDYVPHRIVLTVTSEGRFGISASVARPDGTVARQSGWQTDPTWTYVTTAYGDHGPYALVGVQGEADGPPARVTITVDGKLTAEATTSGPSNFALIIG